MFLSSRVFLLTVQKSCRKVKIEDRHERRKSHSLMSKFSYHQQSDLPPESSSYLAQTIALPASFFCVKALQMQSSACRLNSRYLLRTSAKISSEGTSMKCPWPVTTSNYDFSELARKPANYQSFILPPGRQRGFIRSVVGCLSWRKAKARKPERGAIRAVMGCDAVLTLNSRTFRSEIPFCRSKRWEISFLLPTK